MVLTALRGAVGFLTRIPSGHDEAAWNAFAATPATIPAVGYLVGGIVALPVLASSVVPALPAATVALAYVVALYLLTGITHLDGVADLGDAAVVHGDRERKREAMTDSLVGTGGALAIAVTILGLASAAVALAGRPWQAVGIVVAAEVGAKTGMALVVCFGTAAFEGLGSALSGSATSRTALPVAVLAAPATIFAWPVVQASIAAVAAAVLVAALVYAWAKRTLGGLNGDVLGAANELGRVAALHAGVIAWTLS